MIVLHLSIIVIIIIIITYGPILKGAPLSRDQQPSNQINSMEINLGQSIANEVEGGQSGDKQWNQYDIQEYLRKYGYLEPYVGNAVNNLTSVEDDRAMMREALKKFQIFNKLPVTGQFDSTTESQMNTPRCQVADDVIGMTSRKLEMVKEKKRRRRRKRFFLSGSKWRKSTLTYTLLNYPSSDLLTNRTLIDDIIATSLNDWASVIPISFQKVSAYPDVRLSFEKYTHGDGNPFDGPGGVLAHAFMPEYGIVHFDDLERWTSDSGISVGGVNLRQVGTHEVGHVLGLGHADDPQSVMYAYFGYKSEFRLQKDDLDGIHFLYGNKIQSTIKAPTTTTASSSTTTTSPKPLTSETALKPIEQPNTTPKPLYKWLIKINWVF